MIDLPDGGVPPCPA
ncbi:hypothetical protein SS209_01073 [Salmonella enterica subsp. enterica serovar Senftenberg str. SS209]|nr:hypothetical protein SS209_01073 [Salmonella enterica subsp. enterica serovar Senftenberg str. SS209]